MALLMAYRAGDPYGEERARVFQDSLGRTAAGNARVEVVWLDDSARSVVQAVVDSRPDVIVVNGTPATSAVRKIGTNIPVVFVVVTNPVAAGFVESLSRPGNNITGFSTFEPEIVGKWLNILQEIAPSLRRVGVVTDREFAGFSSLWTTLEALAQSLGLVAVPIHARTASEFAEASTAFAPIAGDGLILFPIPVDVELREALFALAITRRVPAIYPFASHARAGGLVAYGFDANDLFRQAGPYVARILQGELAGDLAVQAPTKFELVVNLKTAAAMQVAIPPSLLARADEVIE